MKRLPVAVALSLTIAACQQPAPPPASTAATPPGAPAKPENGAWGVDLSNMDTAIKPGDDFYRYVNGKWNQRTEIPADKQDVGGLNSLQDKALEQTKVLLEAAVADTHGRAWQRDPQAGRLVHLLPGRGRHRKGRLRTDHSRSSMPSPQSPTATSWSDLFAKNHGALGLRPLAIGVDFDRNVKDTARPSIDISGLTLGARDFYLEPAYAPVRQLQLAHIGRPAEGRRIRRCGGPRQARAGPGDQDRADHLDLGRAARRPQEEQRDHGRGAVAAGAGDRLAEVPRRGRACGAPEKVILLTPSSVKAMVELVNKEPIEAWQDYMRYVAVAGTSSYLPKAARDEMFEFLGKELRGMQEPAAALDRRHPRSRRPRQAACPIR